MMDKIPYHKPLQLEEEELDVLSLQIKEVIKSGKLTNGDYVRKLENAIKLFYDVDYCIATSNCTMGLLICIDFLISKSNRYLQVPMFNWWSDLYILQTLKQDVTWLDVDLETWLPIEKYGCASLYLNTFGNVGKSKSHNAIYDSSHCLGASIKELGLAHVFSLAPTKLITSCEGGLIITNNKKLYDFACEHRDKMCRMSEIHAVIGLKTLGYLNMAMNWKDLVYTYYKAYIPGMFQKIPYNSNHNTIGFLNTENLEIPDHIETKQYYEPIHNNGIESNTKAIYKDMVCLPSYYQCHYYQIVNDILEYNHL